MAWRHCSGAIVARKKAAVGICRQNGRLYSIEGLNATSNLRQVLQGRRGAHPHRDGIEFCGGQMLPCLLRADHGTGGDGGGVEEG
jgi:hypothetical protein